MAKLHVIVWWLCNTTKCSLVQYMKAGERCGVFPDNTSCRNRVRQAQKERSPPPPHLLSSHSYTAARRRGKCTRAVEKPPRAAHQREGGGGGPRCEEWRRVTQTGEVRRRPYRNVEQQEEWYCGPLFSHCLILIWITTHIHHEVSTHPRSFCEQTFTEF